MRFLIFYLIFPLSLHGDEIKENWKFSEHRSIKEIKDQEVSVKADKEALIKRLGFPFPKSISVISATKRLNGNNEYFALILKTPAAIESTHQLGIFSSIGDWLKDYSNQPSWTSNASGDSIRLQHKRIKPNKVEYLRISCKKDKSHIYLQFLSQPTQPK